MRKSKNVIFMLLLLIVFIAGCEKEDDPDVRPTITLNDPLNNATNVSVSQPIVVTFSEAMDPTTITALTFSLKQETTAVAGTVTYTGMQATFTPTVNLAANKVFTGTVTTGARDMGGNQMLSNHTFSFTTGAAPDVLKPTITANDPLNNAIDVARNKVLSMTFSEPMDPLTINSSIISLKQGTTAVAGTVAYSGTTATFTPTALLVAGSLYTATVTTGGKDLAGNTLASSIVWTFTTGGSTAVLAPVALGSAGDYVILAKTAINNSSTSAVTGDLGLSPAATSYVTGFSLTNATGYATSAQITGKIYAADMADPTPITLTTAVNNMITAYNDAAGRPSPDFSELGTGNLGGKTLTPGLYKWTNTVTMPSSLTISGGANDVWIFQIAGDLTMSSASSITLTGGAQAKNIFWQVAGQVTLGSTSHFEGVLLSMTGITFQTGASINGRALAQTAVVLDANTIVKPL
jgi:Ice-binding-like/Bacterial Ig-like domain